MFRIANIIRLSLFLLLSMNIFRAGHSCFWTYTVHVNLVNNLPLESKPLYVYCASKDDDLGHHTLSCFLLYDARVSFTNNLPKNSKPLNLHCKSKDDDLGNHTLSYGESWGFKFCVNIFATLFYCNLNWGDKYMSLHAFDGKWYRSVHDPCAGNRGNNCAWTDMSCFFYYEARVSFINYLPQNSKPLDLHCASKDDDLGNHTLGYGESWGFKFCVNPFATLFYCNLYWGNNFMAFHAFEGRWLISLHNPCTGFNRTDCPWKVESEGASLPGGEPSNILYPFLFLLLSMDLLHKGQSCFLYYKVHVSFVNNLPENLRPLYVQCMSKDDDLGIHRLMFGQTWGFKFCVKPFSTLFYCNLNWSSLHIGLQAYNALWILNPCNKGECAWTVIEAGAGLPKGKFHLWDTTE
ncbi:plant self-incompatibility protein S1 family [Striga asiatica]|uniref:Plant self-incompatibility protein S1 family n=1 Tax=Striga asiatica TaxID=4170 RepID=A0A5A7PR16_STRAF|nr:plant self-incompatibility protein S1 family [Striga asiatica]